MKTGKMAWIMMAGCGLMLVGVFLLPALGVKLGGVLPLLLVLMCPVSHLLMMGMMSKGHDRAERPMKVASGHGVRQTTRSEPIALPAPRRPV